MAFLLPDHPYPILRQPLTLTAVTPLFLSYHALAVLAILPNTFILKFPILPFIVWQAWSCAVGLDLSAALAGWLGLQSADRLTLWNVALVLLMIIVAMKSIEWTFTERPLRRYELPEGRDSPVERPLSVSNVLIDAFDLLCNQQGIGWSWSPNPFLRETTPRSPPPPIASIWANTLLKIMVADVSQYIMQTICPPTDKLGGGSIFDPTLPLLPRTLLGVSTAIFGGVWLYALIDSMYHIGMLIGRHLLRQPASHWPPLFRRPWMATSIRDFWSNRWHQSLRHIFVVFGARPGGRLLGRAGAVMGAFAVSAFIHYLGLWGSGHGTEFHVDGGFFLLMGVGAIMEGAFQRATGLRVGGWLGWLWTMSWTLVWGTPLIDGWARRGMFATDFFPDRLRPGKMLVDGAISLFSM